MSQQPRSQSIDPPVAADATPASAAPPAPSNAPTIFLLILVIGMMGFIAWWAFLSEGARAKANALLPARTPLDAAPAHPKPTVAPVPAASAVAAARQTFGLRRASSARAAAPDDSAPNDAMPVVREVPAPAPKRQKPVSRAAESDD